MKTDTTRRETFKWVGAIAAGVAAVSRVKKAGAGTRKPPGPGDLPPEFAVTREDLNLKFAQSPGDLKLSFSKFRGSKGAWRRQTRKKLGRLMGIGKPKPGPVREIRQIKHKGVTIRAMAMDVGNGLEVPAYLLEPEKRRFGDRGIVAIHGHGQAPPLVGSNDDYHLVPGTVLGLGPAMRYPADGNRDGIAKPTAGADEP